MSRAFHADVHFSPVSVIFEQCAFVNGGRCPHGRAGKIGEADDADGEKDRAAIVVHIGTRVHIARLMIASWLLHGMRPLTATQTISREDRPMPW